MFKPFILSNFKVKSGIEHILEQFDLLKYFRWVLTSAEFGWRKPHPAIYQEAITRTSVSPRRILFIGDDPQNDFLTPIEQGMDAVVLDRHKKHKNNHMLKRLDNLNQLVGLVTGSN